MPFQIFTPATGGGAPPIDCTGSGTAQRIGKWDTPAGPCLIDSFIIEIPASLVDQADQNLRVAKHASIGAQSTLVNAGIVLEVNEDRTANIAAAATVSLQRIESSLSGDLAAASQFKGIDIALELNPTNIPAVSSRFTAQEIFISTINAVNKVNVPVTAIRIEIENTGTGRISQLVGLDINVNDVDSTRVDNAFGAHIEAHARNTGVDIQQNCIGICVDAFVNTGACSNTVAIIGHAGDGQFDNPTTQSFTTLAVSTSPTDGPNSKSLNINILCSGAALSSADTLSFVYGIVIGAYTAPNNADGSDNAVNILSRGLNSKNLFIGKVGIGNQFDPPANLRGAVADPPSKLYVEGNFAQKVNLLADVATLATDASLGNHFRVTLGGNRLLGNPTNLVDGQRIVWEFIQDATGNRTLTLDTLFALGDDITSVTLSTTPNKRDFMLGVYNSVTNKIYVTSFVRGY